MSSNILSDLKENTKNKHMLNSFYSCVELFDDNLENLTVAMILIRKQLKTEIRPNLLYKKVIGGEFAFLNSYCEYMLDLPYNTLKNLKNLVNIKKEKILSKIFENKIDFPIFKKDEVGNIYKFNDEIDYEIVFIEDKKCIISDLGFNDDNLKLLHSDKKRGLYHNQPIWCWNNGIKEKQLRFYNSISKCAYSCYSYTVFDFHFDNYKALSLEQIEVLEFVKDGSDD